MMLRQFLAGMLVGGLVAAIIFRRSSQWEMLDLGDELRVCRLELTRGISVIPPDSCKSGDLIWPKRQDGMCYVKDAIQLIQSK